MTRSVSRAPQVPGTAGSPLAMILTVLVFVDTAEVDAGAAPLKDEDRRQPGAQKPACICAGRGWQGQGYNHSGRCWALPHPNIMLFTFSINNLVSK